MKRTLAIIAIAAVLGFSGAQSQTPAPAAQPAAASNLTPLQHLQAIRDANAKTLEQQAKTLLLLTEMEKESQQMKILAKRS